MDRFIVTGDIAEIIVHNRCYPFPAELFEYFVYLPVVQFHDSISLLNQRLED